MVILAVCAVFLAVFGCASDEGVREARPPARLDLAMPSTSTSIEGTAALSDRPRVVVPSWVTEHMDLPPGRVTRVDDRSMSYLAGGSFDDVVAVLVQQFGEPATGEAANGALPQLSWPFEHGSVVALATPSLRWNPPAAIISVSRRSDAR